MKKYKEYHLKGKRFLFDFEKFNELFLEKVEREGMSVTQLEAELAVVVELDNSSIHAWRFRINSPGDKSKIEALATYFGVSVEDLLTEVLTYNTSNESDLEGELNEKCEFRFYPIFSKQYVSAEQFYRRFFETNNIINDNVVMVNPKAGSKIVVANITRNRIRILQSLGESAAAYMCIAELLKKLDLKLVHDDIIETKIIKRIAYEIPESGNFQLPSDYLSQYESRIELSFWDKMRIDAKRKLEQFYCTVENYFRKK